MSNNPREIVRDLFAELEELRSAPVADVPKVTMRPYQKAQADAVFEKWREGKRSVLVCAATGTGKSVLLTEVLCRVLDGEPLAA